MIGKNLRKGNTKSCGCYRNELAAARVRTHGKARTRVYKIWCAMINRGTNPNIRQSYQNIFVHRRYQKFENFYADLGDPPPGMSIDRINNKKNYAPGNLRWATMTMQQRNKNNNLVLTFGNETHCLAEWCEIRGMNYDRVKSRIYRGWSVEKAFTEPCREW